MKIAVVGTGYVGLVAGVCFADAGHDVTCVDTDAKKVERMRAGVVPIYEPGLSDLMARAIREGHLHFTTAHADAVRDAIVAFIAVGTPEGPTGEPDLSFVEAAVRDVCRALHRPAILVLKSTVPVGTARRVKAVAAEATKQRVTVVNNPEFLKEGDAVKDFLYPDRVVIGTDDAEAFEAMRVLYEPFVRAGKPILRMSNESAELTKYASNAMLATRVSFMNEVARLCDATGADVDDVRRGMGTDSRIGSAFLFPGCGYGGSCFPKDTQGLIHVGKKHGVTMHIPAWVEQVNDRQKHLLVEWVKERFGEKLRGKRFAIWGVAFKPRTDDVREAPSLEIIRALLAMGAEVVATDPEAIETGRVALAAESAKHGASLRFASDPLAAAEGADAMLLVTEWNEYRGADLDRLKKALKPPSVVFDGRNVFDPKAMRAAGFTYRSVGRP